jgi:hypothetical protein
LRWITIIPTSNGGVRMVSSMATRPGVAVVQPPERRVLGKGLVAGWPSAAGRRGTWVAASSRGLCLALLERSTSQANPSDAGDGLAHAPDDCAAGAPVDGASGALSRGLLIPTLIGSPTPDAVIDSLQRSSLGGFAPFRIIAADASELATFDWDGSAGHAERRELAPRADCTPWPGPNAAGMDRQAGHMPAALCERWVACLRELGTNAAAQDRFHLGLAEWIATHGPRTPTDADIAPDALGPRDIVHTTITADGAGGVSMTHRDRSGVWPLAIATVVVTRPTTFTARHSHSLGQHE